MIDLQLDASVSRKKEEILETKKLQKQKNVKRKFDTGRRLFSDKKTKVSYAENKIIRICSTT